MTPKRIGLLLILVFSLHPGIPQDLPPAIKAFSPDEYEEHPQIFCLERMENGRRVFGTYSGVLIHDGEAFKTIPVGSGKPVLAMDRAASGRLFIGGRSLIGTIAPDSSGQLNYRSLIPLLPDSLKDFGNVWNVRCRPNGTVYFNAYDHLFRYDGDTILGISPEERFYRLHEPGGGLVVEDRGKGLYRIEGTTKGFFPGSEAISNSSRVVEVLGASGKMERKWAVFTRKKGMFFYDPKSGATDTFPEMKQSSPILKEARPYTAARLDPGRNPYDAAYVVGTDLKGVYFLSEKGAVVHHLSQDDGLPANGVWKVLPDPWGNVWVGTENGIAHLKTGSAFTILKEGGSFEGGVRSVSRALPPKKGESAGSLPLFLATSQGVWAWKESSEGFELLQGAEDHCFDLLPFPYEGASSRMLIAGGDAGLLSSDATPWEADGQGRVDTIRDEHSYSIQALPHPSGRGVLQGGREGVFVFAPSSMEKEWQERLSFQELSEEVEVTGWDRPEEEEDSLRLWAGMPTKGLMVFETDSSFTGYERSRFDSSDGLPSGPVKIFPDPRGEGKLFGTDEGLYEKEKGGFEPFCDLGRIFCDGSFQIFRMKEGKDGSVWIKKHGGSQLHHFRPKEEGYEQDSTVFRALDMGVIRSIFPAREKVWFGADQGLACYHPSLKDFYKGDWYCRIRKVEGFGDSLLHSGHYSKRPKEGKGLYSGERILRTPTDSQPRSMVPVLPYSKNRLKFRYGAPYPVRQEDVSYRYKLKGFDTSWSRWSRESKKEYTNLPEGSYVFRVEARNIFHGKSARASYRFRVLPPWYRTWWAYTSYSLAGVGLIWLLVRLNSLRLLAQKERLERTVEERTQEIREQKEEVETQKQKVEQAHDRLQEAHEEITQSIDYAQKIQFALLQSEEQVSPHLPEHFVLFKPQSQVSGDFYWAKEHKGYFYFAAVDCTGHGVPGAFMSMLGISQLNEIMNTEKTPTPGEILTELRERVIRELSGADPESAAKDGMDAAMVRMPIPDSDSNSGETIELQFAGAQNPLYVIRKGIAEDPPLASMEEQGKEGERHVGSDRDPNPIKPFKKSSDGIEIKGDGQPVGYDEYAKDSFTTVTLKLRKGDMLYFFSDGFADQFGGPKGKKFRYGPFKQLLVSLHDRPLEEQKSELDRTFEEWKNASAQEQIDDVVVIGLRL